MASHNVSVTETRRMEAVELTVGDYRRLYENVPDDVRVNTVLTPGDRPWESGTITVSITVPQTRTVTKATDVAEWRDR